MWQEIIKNVANEYKFLIHAEKYQPVVKKINNKVIKYLGHPYNNWGGNFQFNSRSQKCFLKNYGWTMKNDSLKFIFKVKKEKWLPSRIFFNLIISPWIIFHFPSVFLWKIAKIYFWMPCFWQFYSSAVSFSTRPLATVSMNISEMTVFFLSLSLSNYLLNQTQLKAVLSLYPKI